MSLLLKMGSSSKSLKIPPNILILADQKEEFKKIKLFVQSLIGINIYTIYNIESKELYKSNLWMTNCALLIEGTIDSNEKCLSFMQYLQHGGVILTLPNPKQEDFLEKNYAQNENSISKCLDFDKSLQESIVLYSFKNADGVHYNSKVNSILRNVYIF